MRFMFRYQWARADLAVGCVSANSFRRFRVITCIEDQIRVSPSNHRSNMINVVFNEKKKPNPIVGPQRGAFTLVELLVVIAIVSILAGLLLPALAHGTAAARGTECRQNLRDVGLGLRMYLDDSNDYPTTGGFGVLLRDPAYGWLMFDDWKETLTPFIGLKDDPDSYAALKKLRCPQLVRTEDGVQGNGQYALNASGTAKLNDASHLGLSGYEDRSTRPTTYRFTPESRIQAPSEMIAAGDIEPGSPTPGFFWSSGYFDPVSTNRWYWPGKLHSGAANMLFCDSHVESSRQTNWLAASDPARRRWNSDHETHPETWGR